MGRILIAIWSDKKSLSGVPQETVQITVKAQHSGGFYDTNYLPVCHSPVINTKKGPHKSKVEENESSSWAKIEDKRKTRVVLEPMWLATSNDTIFLKEGDCIGGFFV